MYINIKNIKLNIKIFKLYPTKFTLFAILYQYSNLSLQQQ
jgi:hypothetical protein